MNGYMPQNSSIIAGIVAGLACELLVGFGITRMGSVKIARACAWLLVVGAVTGIERLSAPEPAGVRMLAIIGALLLGMKVLVSVEEQSSGRLKLSPLRWLLFATGWPGMRPSTFMAIPGPPQSRWPELLKQGLANLIAGSVLIALAWGIGSVNEDSLFSQYRMLIATLFLLPGLSLFMHFGIFNLLAGFWRWWGGSCHALFRAPFQSTSLTEFWGRRWNLAFSEMTTLGVFRPLRSLTGARGATIVAFLFSGILHELAISVPVGAGYGLPLLYFGLHAVAMQIESALSRRGQPINTCRWKGRLWTMAWLVLPLPILFHIPFLRGCVWPLIGLTDIG